MKVYRCTSCGSLSYPVHFVCRECRSQGFEEVEVSGGRLVTYTAIHVPPTGVQAPLLLGIVEFPGGLRALGQLAGPAEVGDEVVAEWVVLRTMEGRELEGYRFRKREG